MNVRLIHYVRQLRNAKFWRRRRLVKRTNLIDFHDIDLVLDVGANQGDYGSQMRSIGFKKQIISYEPIKEPFEKLNSLCQKDRLWNAENFALGDKNEEKVIHISKNSESSSLLAISQQHLSVTPNAEVKEDRLIKVKTLDSLLDSYEDYDNIYLKIDAQGYEFTILKGAEKALKSKIKGLQLEVSIKPLYEGEANYETIISYLKSFGFELMSIEPGFYDEKTGRLYQFDAILFKES